MRKRYIRASHRRAKRGMSESTKMRRAVITEDDQPKYFLDEIYDASDWINIAYDLVISDAEIIMHIAKAGYGSNTKLFYSDMFWEFFEEVLYESGTLSAIDIWDKIIDTVGDDKIIAEFKEWLLGDYGYLFAETDEGIGE